MGRAPYVFFLAHAGANTESAKKLRNLLHPDVTVFLDAYDLAPGDQWDVELPRAQRESQATVALLSAEVEPAYYLQEEIATAVALQRHDADVHRLIPVYLDGFPQDPYDIPYGIRVRHALDAKAIGLDGVAAELRKWVPDLEGAPPPALLAALPQPVDRFDVFDALCKLLLPQFDEVLFRINAPKQHLAPETQPLSRRALDAVQWAEGSNCLTDLSQSIRKVAPGVLP